jgi:hypothetical protein
MKTIEINNKHYQECEVIMLPTDKWSSVVHSTNKYGGLFKSEHYSPMKDMGDSYQHLYILSNEEITLSSNNEGWFLRSHSMTNNTDVIQNPQFTSKYKYKRIIATTDNSLLVKNNDMFSTELPQIPQQFIDYYINEYNRGNIITKLLVEVEMWAHSEENPQWKVKLNQDNEVSILISDKSIIHKFVRKVQEEFPEINHDYLTFKADMFISDNELYTKDELIKFGLKVLELGFDLSRNPMPRLNNKSGKEYYHDWVKKHLK